MALRDAPTSSTIAADVQHNARGPRVATDYGNGVNINELRDSLDLIGVDRRVYALPDDLLPYEGFVLRRRLEGPWEIVYCSRGLMNEVSRFEPHEATEERACSMMLELLSDDQKHIRQSRG